MTKEIYGLFYFIILLIVFGIGGFLQSSEYITPTQTNFVVLFFVFVLILSQGFYLKVSSLALFFIYTLLLLFYVVNGSQLPSLLVYFYYFTCAFFSYVLGLMSYKLINKLKLVRIIVWFLFLQMIVTSYQAIDAGVFLSQSDQVDVVYGTFYRYSDATLVTVSTLLLMVVYKMTPSFGYRLFSVAFSLISVLNSFSTAGFYVYLICVFLLNMQYLANAFNLLLSRYKIIALLISLFFLMHLYNYYSSYVNEFLQLVGDEFNSVAWGERAGRFTPLGQMLKDGVPFFGYGFLTYYDPRTSEWLYDSGFSTYYSLLIDMGYPGVISFLCFCYFFFFRGMKIDVNFFMIFLITLTFSFFNFSLSDIAFFSVLSFVCCLYRDRKDERMDSR